MRLTNQPVRQSGEGEVPLISGILTSIRTSPSEALHDRVGPLLSVLQTQEVALPTRTLPQILKMLFWNKPWISASVHEMLRNAELMKSCLADLQS